MQDQDVQARIRRSLSVPGNRKNRSLRRADSLGVIRVIPTTPRPIPVNTTASSDGIEETVDGIFTSKTLLHHFNRTNCLLLKQNWFILLNS